MFLGASPQSPATTCLTSRGVEKFGMSNLIHVALHSTQKLREVPSPLRFLVQRCPKKIRERSALAHFPPPPLGGHCRPFR